MLHSLVLSQRQGVVVVVVVVVFFSNFYVFLVSLDIAYKRGGTGRIE